MKLKELKHNHSLTDLLKVLIFSILMFTPLLSVATRCLYVICNKNAYQSAEITQTTYNKVETQVPTSTPTSFDELITGNYYYLNELTLDNFNPNSQSLYFESTNTLSINIDDITNQSTDEIYIDGSTSLTFPVKSKITISYNYISFEEQFGNGDSYINFFVEGDTIELTGDIKIIDVYTSPDFDYFDEEVFLSSTYKIINYEEIESTTLDNVFEYSVNKLAESPILSWTQQTAIYTGVNTMTTQLGISTPTIPMLIVYWFLLTVIYIIIDIIIKLFTWLTHMIGSKSV